MKKNDLLLWMQNKGMAPSPVQGFAFGGIANPAQRARLRSSDQEYLDKRLQELNAYEAQRAAYNTGLTKYQEEVYKPYQSQAEAYNTAAQKYNEEVYNPYKSQYEGYEKAIAEYNAGPRTTDYAGPTEPTLASKFEMTAPTAPEAFSMLSPEAPFKEEEVAAYQQEAAQRARADAADRGVAIDVITDPDKYNFGSMSVSNRFMAQGGLVEDERVGLEPEEPMAQPEPRPGPTAADALERLARSLDNKTYTDSIYQGSKGPSTIIDGKKYLVDEETGKVLNNIELNPDTLTSEYSMMFPRSSSPPINKGEEEEREDTMTDEGVSTKEPDLDFIRRVAPDERIASDTFTTSLSDGPNSQAKNMLQKMTSIVAKAGRGEDRQLAHLSPQATALLKSQGGSGTINPATGLREFLVMYLPAERYDEAAKTNFRDSEGKWLPEFGTITQVRRGDYTPGYLEAQAAAAEARRKAAEDAAAELARANAQRAAADVRIAEREAAERAAAEAARLAAIKEAEKIKVRDPRSVGSIAGTVASSYRPIATPDFSFNTRSISPLSPVNLDNRYLRTPDAVTSRDPRFRVTAPPRQPRDDRPEQPIALPDFIDNRLNRIPTATDIALPDMQDPKNAATDLKNFFALDPSKPASIPGLTPGTVSLAPLDLPVAAGKKTLAAIAANPNLSPEMLGGRENAGIMTDRLGNKIYSPGAKPLLYKAGGEVDISSINNYLLQDEDEDPINTDPVGSARKLLADLTGPKQSVTEITQSPNAKSIKRISKKTSAGPGVSKGMSLEYEALSSAKDLVPTLGDQGSARAQMEALATAYKLKAKQATNKARGLMQDTLGAPTLEQPTLTKVGLTAKRFERGGEVSILGARMAEDEPTAPAPLVTEPPRSLPRGQANARKTLESLKDVAERTVSLDPQPDANLADTAVDVVGGFIPGVSQALAARDIERARRDDDKLGMALAASSFIPFGKAYNAAKSSISRAPGGYFPTSRTPGVNYSDFDEKIADLSKKVKERTEEGPQQNAIMQLFNQKMKDFFGKQAGSVKDPLRSDILSGKIKFADESPMGDVFPQTLVKSANQGDLQALRLLEKNYDNMIPIKTTVPYKEGTIPPDTSSVTTGIMASIRDNLDSIPDSQLLAYAGKKPTAAGLDIISDEQLLAYAGKKPAARPDGIAIAAAEVRQRIKDDPALLSTVSIAKTAAELRQTLKENPAYFSTVLEPNIARTLFPSVSTAADEDIARFPSLYSQGLGDKMLSPGQVFNRDRKGPLPDNFFLPELQMAIDKNQPTLTTRPGINILGLDTNELLTQALKLPTKDLEQASFTDFIKKAYQSKQAVEAYERELKKVKPQIQKGSAPSASVMTQHVKDFLPVNNDMRWVKVTNPDGVRPIAAGMDNSVARYADFGTYGALEKGRAALVNGEVEIFSLYNKDNIPQMTVEYLTSKAKIPERKKDLKPNTIVQLTGNGPLTANVLPENFAPEIAALANKLDVGAKGLPYTIEGLFSNKNIVFKDGQWTGLNK